MDVREISPVNLLIATAAVVTALYVIWQRVAVPTYRLQKRVQDFLDDWHGRGVRPGHDAQPGMLERMHLVEEQLAEVKREIRPNSGGSLRDSVDRTEKALHLLMQKVTDEDTDIRRDMEKKYSESVGDRQGIREALERIEAEAKTYHAMALEEHIRERVERQAVAADLQARREVEDADREAIASQQHEEHETILDEVQDGQD